MYIGGLLRGRALAWVEAEDSVVPLATGSLDSFFLNSFKAVFDLPDYAGNVAQRLLQISQGEDSVADYSIRFRTLVAETGGMRELSTEYSFRASIIISRMSLLPETMPRTSTFSSP